MTASARARAQATARDAVVVDVSPPGALDAYRLRAAIGIELGVDAVGEDDARAATARGSLQVVVDAASHRLTVSYRKKTEAETRTVDLSADPEAAQRAAVVLAGNLGRDEASELAAQLRKEAPAKPETVTPPALAPPGRAGADDSALTEGQSDERDLLATLDYYAGQDRRLRLALGWTMAGGAALAAGAVAATPLINGWPSARASAYWRGTGLLTLPLGAVALLSLIPILSPTRLEQLAEYDRDGAGPRATADAWVKAAEHEHSVRRVGGVIGLVAGGIALGLGLAEAVYQDPQQDPALRTLTATLLVGTGAFDTIIGIAFLANDGPIETALHAYERSQGIPLWKLAKHVAVAPTSRGAVGSLSFPF